ncbi:uncharacterized protein LOC131947536 [Physella acuta]|uniref:uncharacterized protein LOC131947536 n=1 Tax=Physella acuta TaxID=109671 RepID=UPI0027DE1681|nr:uncharacterized protein LOC131947536 [Physella acuta]
MGSTIGLSFFILLCLDVLTGATQHCISRLLSCAKFMARGFIADQQDLCKVASEFYGCIEMGCNSSLTPCEMARARNEMLTHFKVCESHISAMDQTCSGINSSSSSVYTRTESVCLLVLISFAVLHICAKLSSRH